MKLRARAVAVAAITSVCTAGAGAAALADEDGRAIDTRADYTPGDAFTPVPESSECVGAGIGPDAESFVIPPDYQQAVFTEENASLEDQWDMHTQNENGREAGRYVYRTHEVGAAANAGDPPRAPGGAGISVTDLTTGETTMLVERNDWERFDGIVWTPWGTLLAAEEVVTATAKDPTVPQANAGLVYELFIDRDDPTQLDGSREPITSPADGTTDTVQDGIRARPALGSKSHEGLRFDHRGHLYGISETRGQTVAGQAGAIFRFEPDENGDLSSGELSVLQTADRRYGEGTWVPLDREAVQVDADAEAEAKGANEYQRPEDVETGESSGVDRNNGGSTVYVAITEGVENGVIAIDVRDSDEPFAYPYVGPEAGNAENPDFVNADNVALDRKGNLAITEDPPGNPIGADIWVAEPRRGSHRPAREVDRLASLKDCEAEPSGVYFAMRSTDGYTDGGPFEGVVTSESLFVHRMHSGQGTINDQSVAIDPADNEGDAD